MSKFTDVMKRRKLEKKQREENVNWTSSEYTRNSANKRVDDIRSKIKEGSAKPIPQNNYREENDEILREFFDEID